MTLPNLFSASRIALTPVLMFLLLADKPGEMFAAALLLILAGITDGFDGYLARRFGQVSTLGVFLDLTADKVLVTGVLVSLVQLQFVPAWVAAIIIGRELIITGLRLAAASVGWIIPAQGWGKSKTVVTLVALTFVILREDLIAGGPVSLLNAFGAGFLLSYFTWPLILLAVALTIVSGFSYLIGAYGVLTAKISRTGGTGPAAFALERRWSEKNQIKRATIFGASSVYRLYRRMREVW